MEHRPLGERRGATDRRRTGRRPRLGLKSAYAVYQLLVGEIGISRDTALRDLRLWEIRRIIRGYTQRQDTLFRVLRQLAFSIMQTGMADLRRAGVNSPADILALASDRDAQPEGLLSDEEIEAMRRSILQEEESKRVKS